jgi:hypothetical protein
MGLPCSNFKNNKLICGNLQLRINVFLDCIITQNLCDQMKVNELSEITSNFDRDGNACETFIGKALKSDVVRNTWTQMREFN